MEKKRVRFEDSESKPSPRSSSSSSSRPLFVFLAASSRFPWKKPWMCAYSPDSGSWVRLPLALGSSSSWGGSVSIFLASAPSLLCFARKINSLNGPQLWVCNPLSGHKKLLPSSPSGLSLKPTDAFGASDDAPDLFQALVVDSATQGFKLFLEGYYRSMEIYDSLTDSWSKASVEVPSQIEFSVSRPVCGGILYCLAKNPSRLVSFDPSRNVWSDPAARTPASVHNPYLYGNKDELLMVGVVRNMKGAEEIQNFKVCIWKFKFENQNWEEVAIMPHALQEEFQKKVDFRAIHIAGQGDLVYFTSLPKASNKRINAPLVYDLSLQSWYWTPQCKLRRKKLFRRTLAAPLWRTMYGFPNMFACGAFQPSMMPIL